MKVDEVPVLVCGSDPNSGQKYEDWSLFVNS